MTGRQPENATQLFISSLILVLLALVFVLVIYPRDFGGYPALIVGAAALVLAVKALKARRHPVQESSASSPVVPAPSGQWPQPLPDTTPTHGSTREVLGVLVGGFMGYMAFVATVAGIADLAVFFVAPFVSAVVSFGVIWVLTRDAPLFVGLVAALGTWSMLNFTPFGLQRDGAIYALIGLVAMVSYLLNWYILKVARQKFGSAYIAAAVVMGVVYMVAGQGVRMYLLSAHNNSLASAYCRCYSLDKQEHTHATTS